MKAIYLMGIGSFLVLASCTLTVSPDGTRTWGVDGAQAARAAVVLVDQEGK